VEVLWEAEKLMVKAEVEALVIVPVVEFKVVMVPVVDQKLVPVRLVDEALVMVPLVDQKFVAVKLVEEAFNVYVVVATVRLPAKNPLPFTERSCPGVVVPMPMLPVLIILIRSIPAVVNLIVLAS